MIRGRRPGVLARHRKGPPRGGSDVERHSSAATAPRSPLPGAGLDDLRGKVGRGLGWSFLSNFVNRLGSVLAGVVLARLLVPADYGAFAVALVVLNAGLSMNELGVSLAVVRWPEHEVSRIAPTVASMALVWSVFLYGLCFVCAPVIASALNVTSATPLIRVLSACILIDALAAVPAALITRQFMQGTRMAVDLTSFFVGTTLSIVLATRGAGVWAMVWGLVISNVLSGVLTLLCAPHRYRPGFDLDAARSLLRFGLPLAWSSLLLFVMLNVDYIIVGGMLGATQLGLYLLAFNLCSWPVNLVSIAVRRVSLAGFSRLAHEATLVGEAFSRSAGLLLALIVPLCVMLAAYAQPVVSFLYGVAWLDSVGPIRWLCVLGGARIAVELAYDYLVAIGRTRANMLLQLLWLSVLAPALYVGVRVDGIRGAAAAHAAVAALVVVPAFLVVLRKNGVSTSRLAKAARRPAVAGFAILATSWVVMSVLRGELPQLLVGGAAALGISAALLSPLAQLARAEAVDAPPEATGSVPSQSVR